MLKIVYFKKPIQKKEKKIENNVNFIRMAPINENIWFHFSVILFLF